ncbi:unnamed protein product [Rotaria magnacalcarata]|uniref:Uncharacterized protein n=3 Tax=Rotaria magnacalcarata TaxID=392030 RepID=A0A819L488_9BILA|nr:unnamed protein product [Rotaria magnacalcarata]CAF1626885.1 unnamed protein product [Rotaria magnacalcarata]CAF1974298.1 unnamed protein product [Rotaria magnacalcarata]CAF2138704.1 unnamed protein product [Rotaria magnacalcarata]CAF2214974.1 unnamed protein product [Rotaria magnacalcarata]
MASLFRNSRSILTRFSCIRRTPTISGASTNPSQLSHSGNVAELAARQRLVPADAIKPRPAGASPFIPMVGTALNSWGKIGFGLFFGISVYFVYINYITNPEFYKSLKLSREATKRSADEKSAHRERTHAQH